MPRTMLVVTALVAGSVAAALAQSGDPLDIAAVRARAAAHAAEAERLTVEVTRRGAALSDDAETVRAAAVARVRRLDPRTLPAGPAGAVDFDQLVGAAGANLEGHRGGAPLLIAFVSLSMPEAALRPILRDVGAAGGVVVFRGFPNNSARAFVAGLARVVARDASLASIAIDPRLFRAFDVRAVPAYVVASSDFDLCDGLACRTAPPPYDAIVGNVSVDYVLSTIAEANGPGARIASVALARLRGPER